MSQINNLTFPELVLFEEYCGNFEKYFNAVYTIFEHDFIKKHPQYDDKKVNVRRYPEVDGIHRTFYHITHEGEDEKNRTPDIRRMERIRFPKFIIDNNQHPEILIWKNKRGNDERVLLMNETENYIVILTERTDYFLLITAYVLDNQHRKNKLLEEYESYKKAKTA
jgi:hypothetical protein